MYQSNGCKVQLIRQIVNIDDLGPEPEFILQDPNDTFGKWWKEVWARVDEADRESGFGMRDRLSLRRYEGNLGMAV